MGLSNPPSLLNYSDFLLGTVREGVDLASVLNPGPRQTEVRWQCWVCFVLPEQAWNVWLCQMAAVKPTANTHKASTEVCGAADSSGIPTARDNDSSGLSDQGTVLMPETNEQEDLSPQELREQQETSVVGPCSLLPGVHSAHPTLRR